MKTVLAIRHIAYEDLDGFEQPFRDRGYQIESRDAWIDDEDIDPLAPDILVIMGAPIGVYDAADYPFIDRELEFIEKRLRAGRPVLGVCFGAQLLATALGSTVYPGQSFEFGWGEISLSKAGEDSPIRHYGGEGRAIFHCHGDTFDLPSGAVHLASSSAFENQAFAYGPHLALQFHGEVSERGLRRWYIAHQAHIAQAGGLSKLREQTSIFSPQLESVADQVIGDWLASHSGRDHDIV